MRRSEPIIVKMYYPQSKSDQSELARRVGEIHADIVIRRIKELSSTDDQKRLLDTIISDARNRCREDPNSNTPPAKPDKEEFDLEPLYKRQ